MNTRRVQPEQIASTTTEGDSSMVHIVASIGAQHYKRAEAPIFVEAPSAEDYEEGPGLFIWVALAIWSVLMFACGWTARYFF